MSNFELKSRRPITNEATFKLQAVGNQLAYWYLLGELQSVLEAFPRFEHGVLPSRSCVAKCRASTTQIIHIEFPCYLNEHYETSTRYTTRRLATMRSPGCCCIRRYKGVSPKRSLHSTPLPSVRSCKLTMVAPSIGESASARPTMYRDAAVWPY